MRENNQSIITIYCKLLTDVKYLILKRTISILNIYNYQEKMIPLFKEKGIIL